MLWYGSPRHGTGKIGGVGGDAMEVTEVIEMSATVTLVTDYSSGLMCGWKRRRASIK